MQLHSNSEYLVEEIKNGNVHLVTYYSTPVPMFIDHVNDIDLSVNEVVVKERYT